MMKTKTKNKNKYTLYIIFSSQFYGRMRMAYIDPLVTGNIAEFTYRFRVRFAIIMLTPAELQ